MKIDLFSIMMLVELIAIPNCNGVLQQLFLLFLMTISCLVIAKHGFVILKKDIHLFVAFFLWLLWNVIVYIMFGGSVARIIQMLAILVIFWATGYQANEGKGISIAKTLSISYVLLWSLLWLMKPDFINYTAYYTNSNLFGAMALNITIFVIAFPRENMWVQDITMGLAVFFVVVSGSRAALLSLCVIAIVYAFSENLPELIKKIGLKSFFPLVVVAIVSFTLVYPTLSSTRLGVALNDMSREIFHKNFFSGRNLIWSRLLTIINESPIFGYGLDRVPNDFFSTNISSHNLYLQTALQTGWVGVGLLLLLLYHIYKSLLLSGTKKGSIISCCLLGILIYQCFEVSLTQNNWPEGLFVWTVFSLGIKKDKNTNVKPLKG